MGLDIPLIDKRVVSHFQQGLQEKKWLALSNSSPAKLASDVNLPFSMDTSSARYVPFNVFALFLRSLKDHLSPSAFTSLLLESADHAAQELQFTELSIQDFLLQFPVDNLLVKQDSGGLSISFKMTTSVASHVESELFLIVYIHAYFISHYADLGKPIRYDLVTRSSEQLSELKIQTDTPQYLGQASTCIQYPPLAKECALEVQAQSMTDTSKVAEALSPYIGRMDLDLDTFCDLNSLGKRTIQRALSQENTTFREVKESLAFDFAKRVLAEQAYSIADVAQHLGYADASQFIRAFKRANGITPYQWKKRNS
ncbi:helix-turn-helix domain-containing protein [Vibrio lentus]|uniref:HTH araC/xylS-type domain-containing protein n=1 Tax=Vibrio lentus TaxID=136468 RepID=A0AB36XH76_9VIBR|nr:AraC family transcriptional regulator [Vibrio lentus]MCC4837284.1 AraC family transcriptional regulator [Vibrio lentus]PMI13912.1 hypothetical protein BCU51_07365 [Vibrio lentus]PMK33838.1 hypothetical protein BCU02_20680 [Vibrio lentus]PMK39669.1 hypothetical protein BCT99_08775 [Vibrio lentus]PML35342.1 hypothetical protein BCT79_01020 [Vibrio lentus]